MCFVVTVKLYCDSNHMQCPSYARNVLLHILLVQQASPPQLLLLKGLLVDFQDCRSGAAGFSKILFKVKESIGLAWLLSE